MKEKPEMSWSQLQRSMTEPEKLTQEEIRELAEYAIFQRGRAEGAMGVIKLVAGHILDSAE